MVRKISSSRYTSSMPYRDLEPVSKQLTIVVGLTVVGFMAFGLALSFYRNVLFEQTLVNFAAQNEKLRVEIGKRRADLEYYRSTQFKDKYAKENLSRVNVGERVLVLAQEPQKILPFTSDTFTPTEAQQAAYEELLRQMPVSEHWQIFLFNRPKLEELRRGL